MTTEHTHIKALSRCWILVAAAVCIAIASLLGSSRSTAGYWLPTASAAGSPSSETGVRRLQFEYTTHDGKRTYALVLLPAWYGADRHPSLPLVICPHGRNTTPEAAAKRWEDLPTRGGFAVVLPAGQGRVLQLYSWGYPGQIADLARMPGLVERAVPGFRYLRKRVYAVGTSMGGQEALLLLARRPDLLAGVIAFDPATDMADRYDKFSELASGSREQRRARIEMGGTPRQAPQAYRMRSPISYVGQIARCGVPLELWWSRKDEVIVDQDQMQAGRLYRQIKLLDPSAPVVRFVGTWRHSGVSTASTKLPQALERIGLLTDASV